VYASRRRGRDIPIAQNEEVIDMAIATALGMTGAAASLLWIIAVVLVISGIVSLIRGGVAAGIVLIIVGLLIGPGGVSIFK
jgi:formate-dependent nitrite reductase membrane component NrfD